MSLSGSKQKSESQQQSSAKTAGQKRLLQKAIDIQTPRLGAGENIFQGERIASLDPLQTGAAQQAGSFLDSFNASRDIPLFGQSQQAISGILSGETGAQKLSQDEVSDFFQRAVADPAQRSFQQDTRPLIREEFSGPGFFSSARGNAVVQSAQDLQDRLGQGLAQAQFENLRANQGLDEAKAGRSLSAIPAVTSLAQLPTVEAQNRLQGLSNVSGFGQQQQAQRQAEINSAVQKFAEENRLTSQEDMAIIMGLLGLNFSTSSGSASSSGISGKIGFPSPTPAGG
jgi:hypothetical protein